MEEYLESGDNLGIITVTKQLCELLLLDLKNFGDPSVVIDLESLIENVKTVSKQFHMLPHYIDTIIFESRIALFDGDFEISNKILNEVYDYVSDKELPYMETKLNQEQQTQNEEFASFERILSNNTSFAKRMEKLELESYLNEALEFRNC